MSDAQFTVSGIAQKPNCWVVIGVRMTHRDTVFLVTVKYEKNGKKWKRSKSQIFDQLLFVEEISDSTITALILSNNASIIINNSNQQDSL